MTRAYVEAPATRYRLEPETWAIIAEEYRNGATAKDVGAKWKVAPSSVYRHACEGGWTKKSMGDARARAHARMVEEEEEASRGLRPVGSRALKSLFAPARADDPDAGDPAALAKLATLASGRAMTGRLWTEARALAGLAESYARLAERVQGPGAVADAEMNLGRERAIHYLQGFERGREKTLTELGLPYTPTPRGEARRMAAVDTEVEQGRLRALDALRQHAVGDIDEGDGSA